MACRARLALGRVRCRAVRQITTKFVEIDTALMPEGLGQCRNQKGLGLTPILITMNCPIVFVSMRSVADADADADGASYIQYQYRKDLIETKTMGSLTSSKSGFIQK